MADEHENFDLTAKKKKKKKEIDFSAMETEGNDENAIPTDADKPAADGEETQELDFGKKKKKKKPKAGEEGADKADGADAAAGIGDANADQAASSDDFTYDDLLKRVYTIMREKNPSMDAGEKRKFVMRPPQVMRAGSKKTAFSNFAEICKLLKREPKHLLAFLLAELGTSGSIDGNNALIIKGKFQQKHVESVLRKYIKEYVTCHTCKSASTVLDKETRLMFLQCGDCGSRCSVATIKSGFQAVTTKRAQTRAAAP